ncbi:MAG: outer membrane lipoprotein carrier protein LolA [Deltaproteobacteria bacterium]|nr:outer membrane lipoprotein carrier protein LolA [Deltaproteobacteria bacterium]
MNALELVTAVIVAASPAPAEVLGKVQASYRQAGDIEARFTQTYVDKLRGKRREESGRMWAKKDGRLNWTYEKPAAKYFIFDGKAAYFYEPENAQVTVFERFQDSPLSSAVRFLWGQGDIGRLFDAKACQASCDAGSPGDLTVDLWPKTPIPTVDHILFAVEPKTGRVRVSVVFDPLGNRTEYRFTDLVFGAKIPDQKLEFEAPKGVSILRATSGSDANP